jgi:hypothetical protein
MNIRRRVSCVKLAMAGVLGVTATASAADLELIYSEIATSPTSVAPGALDLAGQPMTALFTAINALSVRVETDEWVVRGITDAGSDLANILIRGTGSSGTMWIQEGQPLQGGGDVGELYDFFDTPPVSWNASGIIGYSFRARGGAVTTDNEKVATFDGTSHNIFLQQGDALSGLQGACTNPTLGNSVGGVQMLDKGAVAFGNTPITGCHSSLYPALFHNNSAVMQNGITDVTVNNIGEETIESFGFDDAAFTLDGMHYATRAITNNPLATEDLILLIDTTAAMREGTAVTKGSGIILADIFDTTYAPNGDLYVRGDDPSDNDWAVRNGGLIAVTGETITASATELWGNAIGTFTGNSNGDFIVIGNTNNADTNLDSVIVLNGEEVVVREGDPVDVNGNGKFDDDAFISSFTAFHAYLTDDLVLYFLCSLRDGAGTNLQNAFIRADLAPAVPCLADVDDTGAVDVDDLVAVILAWGPCPKPPAECPADIDDSGAVDVDDLVAVILGWGPCE